ncbi:MAG: STAS domain-containing protein [Anaerolineaceae bacterium]
MDFKKTEYKRGTVVKGVGRIDSASAPDLEKIMMDLVQGGKSIILDLQDVDFVSSAGWWSIIRVQKELKKTSNQDLILASLCENVRDSMDLIGILPYFGVYDNLVDAVASL